MRWYVFKVYGSQEFILHSGVTLEQAQKFINDEIEKLALINNIHPREAAKIAGLYLNSYN